jgi:hypothetical protein
MDFSHSWLFNYLNYGLLFFIYLRDVVLFSMLFEVSVVLFDDVVLKR